MSDTRVEHENRRSGAKPRPMVSLLCGLAGGTVGGIAGYFAFVGIRALRWDLDPLLLPGALVGLGCGGMTGRRSIAIGLLCAVAGLGAGIWTEWKTAPFMADPSLGFFIGHLGDLPMRTKVQLVFGMLFAFWFGMGREGGVWRRRRA
jgi:hypothetical protein